MKFVNPYFLYALFAIAIPVIIHLFNFRQFKKIFFSNVEFLKELKQKTQKKSNLKHLLVLISRILAVICLVLAFAQPYIPVKKHIINTHGNVVSVFIDNSFSMEALSSKGNLFEDAKSKALEIANAYRSTDLFQILTNDFEGKNQAYITKEEFVQLPAELEISPSFRKLSEVITRQNDLFSTVNSKGKVAFIISDFSKITTDLSNIKPDTGVEVNLVPLAPGKTNNIYIDSCWFLSPVMQANQVVQINALIKNSSANDAEKIPVKLSVNGRQKTVASVDIPAGSQTIVKMPYTTGAKGFQSGLLEIIDDPVIFDDKFYFGYTVSDSIPVLSINNKTESVYLNSLYGKDSTFAFTNMNVNKIDYSHFPYYKLIILNELKSLSSGLVEELKTYVKEGGCLLVFPAVDADLDDYKTFLLSLCSAYYKSLDTVNTKVSVINTDHEVFTGVFDKLSENMDLPTVKSHYSFNSKTFSSDEYIMKMLNGESFMISQNAGKGKLYLSSVALSSDFSNFTKHAVFVPTLYNIALYSEPVSKLFFTIGKDEAIEVKNSKTKGDNTYRITNKAMNFEIIPEHRNIDLQTYVYPHEQINKAGNYMLMNGEGTVAYVSYNYNRNESELKCYTALELEDMIKEKGLKKFNVLDLKDKNISNVLEELNQGVRLWKVFVILALLFLVAEVVLLRFLKS
jgi:hypothetical protein